MIRRSIRLKSEIRAQAKVLELQRRVVGINYNRLKAHYRSRLVSPGALLTGLVSGLVAGSLLRRGRRSSGRSWLKLGRTIVSPALLYILRTGAARWMHRAGL